MAKTNHVEYLNYIVAHPRMIVLIIGGLMLLIQLFYYLYYYLRIFGVSKSTDAESHHPPLSVIICARDEDENLRKHLPPILEQAYPNYEVIVVDDCSTDETEAVLNGFSQKYPHFRFTRIKQDDKFSHGKKLALTVGIKAAKNNWLVLTDADCRPASKNWLRGLSAHMKPGKELVLGYGGYEKEKGLLNSLIRYETLFIALQYFTFSAARRTYMGVGRNLAYTKDLFFKNKGFASHYHLASGDDDLFVQQATTERNTARCANPEAFTYSVPKHSFAAWDSQKRRHLSTSSHYKRSIRRRLAWEPISRVFFWASIVLGLLWFPAFWPYIVGAAALRWLFQIIVLAKTTRQLNEKKLFFPALGYDILIPFLYFYFWAHNLISVKPNRWK